MLQVRQEDTHRKLTLQSRSVDEPEHKHHNDRPAAPCPRFIAHMITSPDAVAHTEGLSKCDYLPAKEKYELKKPFAKPALKRSTPVCFKAMGLYVKVYLHSNLCNYSKSFKTIPDLKNSIFIRTRKREPKWTTFHRKPSHHSTRKHVPSIASSDDELDDVVVSENGSTIKSRKTPVPLIPAQNEENEWKKKSTHLLNSSEAESYSKPDDINIFGNQPSPCSFENLECIDLSKPCVNDVSSQYGCSEDSDLSGRVSFCSTIYRSCGTPLSQLRSSSLSLPVGDSAESEEEFGNYSRKNTEHKSSLLAGSGYCSSILNPVLSSCSNYGNADLPQALSNSMRKCSEAAGLASSFLEIWHDHLRPHWPVLPPISPQRDFSNGSSDNEEDRRSQSSVVSTGTQDAFDELENIVQFTGSTSSLEQREHTENLFNKDFPSVSDICKQTASLNLGFSDNEEVSLADLRLALLDQTSFGRRNHPYEVNGSEWDNSISRSTMEKTSAYTMIYTQGPSLPSAPAILNVTKTSDTNSNKGIEDQQNSYTIISETNSGIQDELCNRCETRTDQNNTMLCPEPFRHEVYSPNHLKGPKYDKETCKKEGVRILKTEKIEDQPSPVKKRRPVKLDHSVIREMEMQIIAEERRAKAVYMYSMLKSTRSTTIRGTQPMSISKFEDFDFLAKYCIFSQEKLAEYKRAFEAADEDNDGFLDCLQVLMALKEIVPPNALSDAEELYVCRILEIVDYYVTDGLTDLRLFAVMASLAQKIAALE
ncbi:uncharacterized protein LOC128664420 [Bombina bombina]|uniref:uncharacterized protein LOC128664420 n=1 Tax=Bombina bombina TaxID=8345 RepID=UPI00235B1579|nr:uncharacterized protein LOC128664420 [Bombina bombina]